MLTLRDGNKIIPLSEKETSIRNRRTLKISYPHWKLFATP